MCENISLYGINIPFLLLKSYLHTTNILNNKETLYITVLEFSEQASGVRSAV